MDSVASSTPSWLTSLRIIAADIKLAHSVFAMPFALLAAFMAALPVNDGRWAVVTVDGMTMLPPAPNAAASSEFWSRFAGQLGLIILAMIFARTCAMLANRLLDSQIDARNPRTAGRAIPSGRLLPAQAVTVFLASAVLFILTCAAFGWFYDNWWPLYLGVPVLAWICAYAWFKRFTWMCHIYLGSSLALSPLAAAIAINPESLSTQPALFLLSGMVLCWVAGFDIIYALQDVQTDRAEGLNSIPANLGEQRGLWISRVLHALAVVLLVVAWWIDDRFALLFGIGIIIVALLLIYEHATVRKWGTTRIALTFFTLNGVISCILGGLGITDVLV